MNYIKHLTSFFELAANDERLNSTHISLYMALFQFWNLNRFVNPISISRSELMRISKISAKATYHKVMKDLQAYGYIRYKPSYNPYKGSCVHLINFCASVEQLVNQRRPKMGTSIEQAVVPSINSINNTNNKLAYEPANKNTSSDNSGASEAEGAEDDRENNLPGRGAVPESLEEVKQFFEEQKSTRIEAEKFYNYFQSNGWKVGGRAPMKDWKASARNWILNSHKFSSSPKNQIVDSNKNYSEPL